MTPKRRIIKLTTVATSTFQGFFSSASASGIAILVMTAVAMVWINSPWHGSYESFIHLPIKLQLFTLNLNFSFAHFVNDSLMVAFFLVVGLELKREVLVGELSSLKKSMLPMIAALFGMVAPALIFLAFNGGTPAARGWGIPVATDIAFALGILALAGPRIPIGVRVFLAALAIVDDLLSVLIIALVYTADLNVTMVLWSVIITAVLYAGNRLGIHNLKFYSFLGIALWVTVLFSGVHATIAGVVLAMTIPAKRLIDGPSFFERSRALVDEVLRRSDARTDESTQMDAVHALEKLAESVQTPLHRIEHTLQPYVSLLIMPLFALVNAGIVVDVKLLDGLLSPVALGIILGLFIGKQVGVTFAVWVSVKLGFAILPQNATFLQLYGVALLCGVGFTMAIFVASLAFVDPMHLDAAKLAILVGSALSAITGTVILRFSQPAVKAS